MNDPKVYQDLFDFFEKHVTFTEREKIGFTSMLNLKKIKKGDTITEYGAVEQHLTFISSGICRGYCMKGDDDVTLAIGFAGSFFSSYASFTQRTPSQIGVEALTDMTIYQLRYEALAQLYAGSKEGERMGRLSAENLQAIGEHRLIDMLTKSAAERYETLLENDPKLLLTIPQKYVAEYLGIKPESLSRIKKQLG